MMPFASSAASTMRSPRATLSAALRQNSSAFSRVIGSMKLTDAPPSTQSIRTSLRPSISRSPIFSSDRMRVEAILFPLDRPGRLRRHVVDDAIDATHFVDDAGRDATKEVHFEGVEVGGHSVGGSYRAQTDDMLVGTSVAHDAYGLHREDHGKGLPDLVVQTGAADLFEINLVGEAKNIQLVACDLAGAADRKTGTWKRVPADEGFRQAKLAAERPHLVLEQLA